MQTIEEIDFKEGEFVLSVRVEPQTETVWLNRHQMAQLFERDIKTIGKHIQAALKEELEDSTVAKFATVQIEGNREVMRQVEYYNLDMIISVGYRVKSARGVQFRRWATKVLRQYLMQGYVCQQQRLQDLSTSIRVMKRVENKLDSSQILEVVQQYTRSLDLLDDYDHQRLRKPDGDTLAYVLTYEECRKLIDSMHYGTTSSVFGNEKDDSFKGSLGNIYQSFCGHDVYPSVQEKAANLLYLVTKNHAFFGWQHAGGVRIRTGATRKYASKKYIPLLRFKTTNGQEQDAWGSRANNDYKNLCPGDKLQIVYNPNSPDKIEILDETEEKNNTCVMIVGGIFILAGMFTVPSCFRKKRRHS